MCIVYNNNTFEIAKKKYIIRFPLLKQFPYPENNGGECAKNINVNLGSTLVF